MRGGMSWSRAWSIAVKANPPTRPAPMRKPSWLAQVFWVSVGIFAIASSIGIKLDPVVIIAVVGTIFALVKMRSDRRLQHLRRNSLGRARRQDRY